jgi:hypothetical protein
MNFSNLILFAIAFAAIYPLYFWIPADRSFANKFCKFNITLPNAIGGIVLVTVWLIDIPLSLKLIVTVWKAVLFYISHYSWKRKYADPKLMTIPSLIGIYAFIRMQAYFASSGGMVALIDIFGG